MPAPPWAPMSCRSTSRSKSRRCSRSPDPKRQDADALGRGYAAILGDGLTRRRRAGTVCGCAVARPLRQLFLHLLLERPVALGIEEIFTLLADELMALGQ